MRMVVTFSKCIWEEIRSKQTLKPWPSDNIKQNEIKNPVDSKFDFKFISASVVTRFISSLKNTKALGVDKIATEALKKGVITLSGPIARLCNISMASGVVPDLFQKSKSILFTRKGKPWRSL